MRLVLLPRKTAAVPFQHSLKTPPKELLQHPTLTFTNYSGFFLSSLFSFVTRLDLLIRTEENRGGRIHFVLPLSRSSPETLIVS